MARIKKKGKAGQARNFITRTQAVRKLQVSLSDFRRLCIFKGIYPREPRSKKKASKTSGPNTTFYYSKDIQYLLHEPLLAKFREHKAISKKIARSLGKGEVGDAARLDRTHNKRLSLDHIIKERYPTFVDALRDLDDALSLLFLFSHLPSTSTISPKTIARCQQLCHEFQHYLIISHTLRKSFISIKGIYYQATIQGQDILWLVPHKFVQRLTNDVDFRIMATFIEFYMTLLGFVNYRLYTSIGLVYPPKMDIGADEDGAELNALQIEGQMLNLARTDAEMGKQTGGVTNATDQDVDEATQERVDKLTRSDEPLQVKDDNLLEGDESVPNLASNIDTIDTFETSGSGADSLVQPLQESAIVGSLFKNMNFFLSRETPRQPLEFLLRAFGAQKLGWDSVLGKGANTNNELDSSITHQIVDRPPYTETRDNREDGVTKDNPSEARPKTYQYGHIVPGRIYVQPQWVWDCINSCKVLRADDYAPGALLPPHLSPFVKPKQGEYDPRKSLAEQEREGEAEKFGVMESLTSNQVYKTNEDEKYHDEQLKDYGSNRGSIGSETNSDVNRDDDEASDRDSMGPSDGDEQSLSLSEQDEVDDPDAGITHQAELEAEARLSSDTRAEKRTGDVRPVPKGNKTQKRVENRSKVEEDLARRIGMMPRKKKKLYEKMQYSLKRSSDEAEKLRTKRRRLGMKTSVA